MNPDSIKLKNASITIIIPTYNRCKLLDLTLDSIRKQSISLDFLEVIVVDDGSTDDTFLVTKKYESFLNVKYFHQEDLGYRVASARNIGIRNASGEILLFIDSGVVLASNCVISHLKEHSNAEKDLVILGYIYFPKDINLHKTYRENSIVEQFSDTSCFDYREPVYALCQDEVSKLPAPWVLCWTGNLSVKKTHVVKVGLFDESFDYNWGIEDVDLGFRLYQMNLEFKLSRGASSYHYPHESDDAKKSIQEQINKMNFHKKHSVSGSAALLNHSTISLNIHLMNSSNPSANIIAE